MEADGKSNSVIEWINAKVTEHQLILILSVIAGIISGFAALIIKYTAYFIQDLLLDGFADPFHNYIYLILPAIGILASVLFMHIILKRQVGQGIPLTLFAISQRQGRIHPHNMGSSIITSSLTVGFGGSAGLEGPTIATGAAWGSNIGQKFGLSYRNMILLLACSSAGTMAAIFKAPIAGVVFVLEVLMIDLTIASIIPLLLASLAAAIVSYLFLGMDVLVPVEITTDFVIGEIPYLLLFGIFAGLVSVYFTRAFKWVERIFDTIKGRYTKWITGSICLGLILFMFPAIYGEGYGIINSAIQGDINFLFDTPLLSGLQENIFTILILLAFLISLKVIATGITFQSGGVGGIFAPTLFMGALSGLFFALLLNHFELHTLPIEHFVLAGMGGLIAGVLHAPLTGIFLIAELTGGYELLFPLMITATASFLISRKFDNDSVYTYQLRRRGELFTHDKDQVILSIMDVENLIEKNFSTIHENATLGDLTEVIINSRRDIFPVIDSDKNLKGIIYLNDVRSLMFDEEMYDRITVKELMHVPEGTISIDESMQEVARKFQSMNYYNLPVLEGTKYRGFVSRANVFSAYRKLLRTMTEE